MVPIEQKDWTEEDRASKLGQNHPLDSTKSILLFSHPPSEQHHSRPERRCNYRRHYPAAEREKHRDVISNQRASNTHQCACDAAAG